jgi:hypothetical protein
MRIENLRTESHGQLARQVATVSWEDCDRPARDIFFETDQLIAQDWTPEPHAFLTACIIPAMRHGEQRLKIDAPVAPELRNGLLTNMTYLRQWYGQPRRVVQIETAGTARAPRWPVSPRTASFLSGGIDSLATLRANRLDYACHHPYSIQDCLIVHGFDIGGREVAGQESAYFDRAIEALTAIAQDAQVELIPVSTNIRHLDDDVKFWMYEFHGAALAAVAHALSRRLSRIYIASSMCVWDLEPWGSHPALDSNYSSGDLSIQHDGLLLSRLDKVRLIADWDIAVRHLRVCTMNPMNELNCGQCEKCLRTLLELVAVGPLPPDILFPIHEVSREQILTMPLEEGFPASWYQELLEPLATHGRPDLAEAVQAKLSEYNQHLRWQQEKDWKGIVKRFDRKFLHQGMYRSYKIARRFARLFAPRLQLFIGTVICLGVSTNLTGVAP